MSATFNKLLQAYGAVSESHPWTTAFTTCLVKGCISDVVAQRIVEGNAKVDVKRTAVYGFYGGWYCGWVQHGVYNIIYTRMFGPSATVFNAVRKVAFDSIVTVPVVVFPVYYMYKHTLYDGDGPLAGLKDCQAHLVEMCTSYYTVWVPANLLVFTIVPVRFRIGMIACTSLGWLTISSYLTHTHDKRATDVAS
ncbi:hypothetical protein M885DRAFT_522489 [Pelagophyceae sp. CCMP2097]|nr:hypothetical protein M885DRAFT_522489 [Pelagophyceae sp. CCMP2097]